MCVRIDLISVCEVGLRAKGYVKKKKREKKKYVRSFICACAGFGGSYVVLWFKVRLCGHCRCCVFCISPAEVGTKAEIYIS